MPTKNTVLTFVAKTMIDSEKNSVQLQLTKEIEVEVKENTQFYSTPLKKTSLILRFVF